MKKGNIKKIAVGRKDLYMLAPCSIAIDEGWNVRQDTEDLKSHIRQLADSIKEIGVQLPLTVYTRSLHMSYQALRSIYRARWNRRHPDWRIFCKFIESLPFFAWLIMPEGSKNVELLP